jgi:DNA polymerase-3 subunit alpha
VVTNIEECRREMGIKILSPDINRGEFRFVAQSDDSIVYGLGAIKGLGEGAIDAVVASRDEGGPFANMFDLCERVDGKKINKRAIDALVNCGALDGLAPDQEDDIDAIRPLMLANRDDALKLAEQKLHNELSGTSDLFGEDMALANDDSNRYNHYDKIKPFSLKDRIHREKDVLGLFLTAHPIDPYPEIRHLASTRIVDLRAGNDEQTIAGCIVAMRTMKSKRGESMAFMTLDDKSGRVEVAVFSDLFDTNYNKLQKDQIIVVKGATSDDDFSGGLKIRATEVYDLIEARERSIKRLQLNLNSHLLPGDFTSELAEMLRPYKGKMGLGCPVSVDYLRHDANARLYLSDAWRVRPEDDLLQNLREHYGAEQVQFVY